MITPEQIRAHARGVSNAGGTRELMFKLADQLERLMKNGENIMPYGIEKLSPEHIEQKGKTNNIIDNMSGSLELADCKDSEIANDFRKIFLLYLEKLEKLTDKERECISNYLYYAGKSFLVKAD